ncbi:hypothetical protein PanWU01x14_249500 [Parasponia andersonii]|uniref:Uncharacterized protein n=1 Tax=Parasponia andersonii TaxID=3476 RepID=A0A2P5BD89_PARAD|nr:hypothetical protein PanWU01x14_249500 [Parasponia andersonii]
MVLYMVLLRQEEKSYYDEKCPGCTMDKLKNSNPGIPFKHLFYVFVVVLGAEIITTRKRVYSDDIAID